MNRVLLAIPLCLFAASAFAGQAQSPPRSVPVDGAGSSLQEAPLASTREADAERKCVRQTGSRIVRRQKDGCIAGAGRSYDHRDIASTGETRAGHALRMLDPAIRIP